MIECYHNDTNYQFKSLFTHFSENIPDSVYMLWETQVSALAMKQLLIFVLTFVLHIDWGIISKGGVWLQKWICT